MIVRLTLKLHFLIILCLCVVVEGGNKIQNSWVEYDSSAKSWTGVSHCDFDADSSSHLSWHFQGRRIDEAVHGPNELVISDYSTGVTTLYISNFTQDNVGAYNCLLVNGLGEISSSQWISSPPVIAPNSGMVVDVGGPVSLSCSTYPGGEPFWILPGLAGQTSANISVTSDANVTSTIQFTAGKATNYANIKCCLKKNAANQRTAIPCSSIHVNVITPPVVDFQTSCNDNYCNLSCMFQAYPDVKTYDVQWTVCSRTSDCYSLREDATYFDDEAHKTVTQLLNVSFNYTFTCYGSNGIGNSSHQFNIDQGYVSPTISEDGITVTGVPDENAVDIRCNFKAFPPPAQYTWMKQSIVESSFGWENVTDSDEHYQILENYGLGFTVLRINDFNSSVDEANLSCCAVNVIGQSCAQTFASVYFGVTVAANNFFPLDGENVTVTCNAFGLPPPLIDVSVVSEFDIDYSLRFVSKFNFSQAEASFVAHWWDNPVVHFHCFVFDDELSSGIHTNIYEFYVNNTPVVYPLNNCSSQDFVENGYCQLSCITQGSKMSDLVDWKWKYWTETPDNSVAIYDGLSSDRLSPFRTQLSLNMSDYNAGVYSCWFLYQLVDGPLELQIDFIIDSSVKGVELHEACESSEECLALDAQCADEICQCVDPYIYSATNTSNSAACLKGCGQFEPCNIDEQCLEAGKNFYCSDHRICDCNGTYEDIPDAEMYLCLVPVTIGGSCSYYQECLLNDNSSNCLNGSCRCIDYFVFNETMDQCTLDMSTSEPPYVPEYTLSMGAIIGIIVGATAVIIMIICIVGLFVGRRRGLI